MPVVDVAGFLSKGQVARLTKQVTTLERDTGVRLRVLSQSYPTTPGLAVRDYWAVDDNTVVFVADPGLGNIINVNVCETRRLLTSNLTLCCARWARTLTCACRARSGRASLENARQ